MSEPRAVHSCTASELATFQLCPARAYYQEQGGTDRLLPVDTTAARLSAAVH